jgi:YVTN family beta-propeller protein
LATKNKLYSTTLAFKALVLLLIFASSTVSASYVQSSLSMGPYAFITNFDSNNVSVIDTVNNNVTAIVNVGSNPFGVAVNPDGTKAYVTNSGNNTVSVIDTTTNNVTSTIKVGSEPIGIAVDPDGIKVYVAARNSNIVSVIDTLNNNVTAAMNVGNNPIGVAVNQKSAYVTNSGSDNISVINITSNTVMDTIDVGQIPTGVAVSPDGIKVYVANQGSNNISVINTTSNTVTDTINVGQNPIGVAATLDGTKVYVANQGSNNVSVINTTTNDVTTVNVGQSPIGIAITPDGTKVYVANQGSNTTSVIDTVTNNIIKTINVGSNPAAFGQFISLLPTQPMLPLANFSSNNSTYGPVAAFSATPISGNVPLNVSFTDESTGLPTTWKWYFGDGTNSTEQNPVHTFSKPGIYTVTLTISSSVGSSSVTKSGYVSVSNSVHGPIAAFSASPTSGNSPLNVNFIDKSTGSPTSWKWYFGDGTNSTEQNPVHTYSKAGIYTVTLTVSNASGINSVTKTGLITVLSNGIRPTTSFSASLTSGNAPLNVSFTDESSGLPTSWKWYFGDGTNSTEQNPVHIYSKVGVYTVTLTASNASGSSSVTKSSYITVSSGDIGPEASFSASPTSGYAPLIVNFTANSTVSPTLWQWYFGEYGTNTTDQNPVHTYSRAGLYTVTLTARNAGGSSLVTKSGYIYVSNSVNTPEATFSASPTSGSAPLVVNFTDKSTGSPTSWKWYFGDGTNTNDQNPVHTYRKAGLYTVTLTVSNAAGSSSVTKSNCITVSNGLTVPIAAFSAIPAAGTAPLNVSFTDESLGSPTSWKWYFGDGTNSTEQNPMHTYSKVGIYSITLTASNAGGISSVTKSSYITVSNGLNTPVAAFSALPSSGTAPLSVSFADESAGFPTSWKWYFGDGTNSTERNPVHTYSKAGIYSVTLTVNNAGGSSSVTKSGWITVSNSLNIPVATFSAYPTSGKAPLNVSFTDESSGFPTLWKWYFGDSTSTTDQNPVHTFNKTGTYTVSLTSTNSGGSSTKLISKYIIVK